MFFQTRDCLAMEKVTKDEEKQRSTHIHFRGGVSMGIGSFNLVKKKICSKILQIVLFNIFSNNVILFLVYILLPDAVFASVQSP